MALRTRTPNRKMVGGKGARRNKNPKLSPYQREQKRNRLANQAPINKQKRDFPAKARDLVAYLDERKAREDAKKEARRAAKEKEGTDDSSAAAPAATAKPAKVPQSTKATPTLEQVAEDAKKKPAKPWKVGVEDTVDLNAENQAALAEDPTIAAYNQKIIRLKEKNAQKKVQRRKKRVIEFRERLLAEMQSTVTKEEKMEAENQKRNDEKQKKRKERLAGLATSDNAEGADGEGQLSKAQIKRQERKAKREREREEGDEVKENPKKLELDEKIDVVKFGDRVEAPPVFDNLPRASNAGLLPTHRVGAAKKLELSERKRLQKLGLLPTTDLGDGTAAGAKAGTDGALMLPAESDARPTTKAGAGKLTSAAEFEAYRQKVLDSYQKHRKPSAVFHPVDYFKANPKKKI